MRERGPRENEQIVDGDNKDVEEESFAVTVDTEANMDLN